MAETKDFSTLDVASAMTGISLDKDFTIRKYHEIAEWLSGHPVRMHELVHPAIKEVFVTEAYDQFPDMPNPEEARVNFETAIEKAIKAYGPTVTVKKGDHRRQASPQETLKRVAPHANIVEVKIDGRKI